MGQPMERTGAFRRVLNEVLNEALNAVCSFIKKGCPKVPFSFHFQPLKNGKKWGWGYSWGYKWGDNSCKHRPL